MILTRVATLLGALALLGPAAAAAPTRTCTFLGATYQARSSNPALGYRLKTEALPRGAEGAAVATLFRFQTLARASGKVLSEIRMYYSCPNGRGACSVSPPSRPGPDGGLYSEVIGLDRDFTLTGGAAAPYALVLPGFGQGDWLFTLDELKSPDLTLAKGAVDGPDLSDQIVWTLSSCGAGA